MKKICIVGASGKLGQYMVQHALDLGYEVVGVCRERSVGKLDRFKGLITVFPGATNDRQVIEKGIDRQKVEALVTARDAARAAKTKEGYAESDRIRDEARTMGIDLMDSPTGTTWKITKVAP